MPAGEQVGQRKYPLNGFVTICRTGRGQVLIIRPDHIIGWSGGAAIGCLSPQQFERERFKSAVQGILAASVAKTGQSMASTPSWGGNNADMGRETLLPQRGEVGRGAIHCFSLLPTRPEIMIDSWIALSMFQRCFQDAGPITGFLLRLPCKFAGIAKGCMLKP
jgi:hypothetical protein